MNEAHFELRLPDGSIKLRKDGTTMQFKPSAYMVIEYCESLVFVQDCRTPARLQFTGGGVEIGTETPLEAAIREADEEIGAVVSTCRFVGQFETYEPVHLFKAVEWTTRSATKGFHKQPGEVSDIRMIDKQILFDISERDRYQPLFYRAQWKMLGWYLLSCSQVSNIQPPVFKLWSEDPWLILDSLR